MTVALKHSASTYLISITFMLLCLLSILLSSSCYAQNIHELERSNEIELLAWVGKQSKDSSNNKTSKFSVNEQVILYIEVATPRWFTGGTRIGSVEIPNVIAKQRNQLATNYTERKEGKTWSRQRWEVTIYPQSPGTYVIPPIAVGVQVSASDGAKVVGTLYTQPIRFEATMPSVLISDKSQWFSATNVEVKQTWSTSNDELKVGDAITRTITIDANDTLSVLLPDLLSGGSTTQYQAYPQPNKRSDMQTRGDYQSSRSEETVYVIQQGGKIKLPEYHFQWWNSKTKQIETQVIAGKIFTATHTLKSFVHAHAFWLVSGMTFIVAMVLVVISIRQYYRKHPIPPWWVFNQMLRDKRWGAARALLYKQLRVNSNSLEMGKADSSDVWKGWCNHIQNGLQDRKLFRSMWKAIGKMKDNHKGLSVPPKALPQLDSRRRETNKSSGKNTSQHSTR
ncbi:BatD family protein [Vibrio hepatarius]|uniref:BatD family protein n=1 Tax=Vibrio hepatarius TaxID=171383 RepID=UPI001C08E27E|nr:BatD family protein [Vibrio hepatarius]MBU2899083.1 BatD family protein [Vibrio hepatarius]